MVPWRFMKVSSLEGLLNTLKLFVNSFDGNVCAWLYGMNIIDL